MEKVRDVGRLAKGYKSMVLVPLRVSRRFLYKPVNSLRNTLLSSLPRLAPRLVTSIGKHNECLDAVYFPNCIENKFLIKHV